MLWARVFRPTLPAGDGERNGSSEHHPDQLRRPGLRRPGLFRVAAEHDASPGPVGVRGNAFHEFLHGLRHLFAVPGGDDDGLLPGTGIHQPGALSGRGGGLESKRNHNRVYPEGTGVRDVHRWQVALWRPAGVHADTVRFRLVLRDPLQQRHGKAGPAVECVSPASPGTQQRGDRAAARSGRSDGTVHGGVRPVHPGQQGSALLSLPSYEAVRELYDLETDVGESRNVFAEQPREVERLAELAAPLRAQLGDAGTDVRGTAVRPCGKVDDPKPMCVYDPDYPYYVAEYDLSDCG